MIGFPQVGRRGEARWAACCRRSGQEDEPHDHVLSVRRRSGRRFPLASVLPVASLKTDSKCILWKSRATNDYHVAAASHRPRASQTGGVCRHDQVVYQRLGAVKPRDACPVSAAGETVLTAKARWALVPSVIAQSD
jgi:hypothetical protein